MNTQDNYWNSLSQREKADIIKVAINNGITTMSEIKQVYNKFAEGGPKRSYDNFATRLSKAWDGEDLSKHDYNYRKYYDDDPDRAYEQLESIEHGGKGHFPDGGESGTYKLPSHPTYPDLGDKSWSNNDTVFHISDRQLDGDTDRLLNYLGEDLNYNNGGTRVMYEDSTLLPSVQVVSRKDNPNFTEAYPGLVPNKYHTGWVYEDSPARAAMFAYGGNTSKRRTVGDIIQDAKDIKDNFTLNTDSLRDRFYKHFDPYSSYTNEGIERAINLVVGGPDYAKRKYPEDKLYIEGAQSPFEDAVWGTYLGIPKENRKYKTSLKESEYKPTRGAEDNTTYYTVPINDATKRLLVDEGSKLDFNQNANTKALFDYNMGTSTVGKGVDNKGEYISYYDIWDVNPLHGDYVNNTLKTDHPILSHLIPDNGKDSFRGITNPVSFYDRIYLDDYYGVDSSAKEGEYYGGYLPEVTVYPWTNKYVTGGPLNEEVPSLKPVRANPRNKRSWESEEEYKERVSQYSEEDLENIEKEIAEANYENSKTREAFLLTDEGKRRYAENKAEDSTFFKGMNIPTQNTESLNHDANLIQNTLASQANISTLGNQINEAVKQQEEDRLNKWQDYKHGLQALETVAELGLSGASLLRAYGNWKKWNTAGSAIKRGVINLLNKNQLPMQVGGTLIDAEQLTRNINNGETGEAIWNGIGVGLGVAGSIGATDVFRNSRFHKPWVDTAMDAAGLIQNAGDYVKFGYDMVSPYFSNEHSYGGNLFKNGGKKKSTSSNTTAQRAMAYLMNKGMSSTGAAAIVGTLQAESSLDPTIHAQMKGDTGEGLAQWTGSRKNTFWKILEGIEPGARKRYGSISKVPFERQLDVVMAERPDVISAISNANNVNTATDIMLRGYENGGGTIGTLATKQQMDNIYGKWNNGYDKQMAKRLGNATNLLGLDMSTYQIPQTFFDDINNQISLPQMQDGNDIDPETVYTPPTIDETLFQTPKQETTIEPVYNPQQERLDNIKKFNTVMGLLGQESPLAIAGNTSTPGLLSAIGSIYGK